MISKLVGVTSNMGASASMLMATIVLAAFIPAKCWIAPDIPTAMYRSGATILPVWPTCIHTQLRLQLPKQLKVWACIVCYNPSGLRGIRQSGVPPHVEISSQGCFISKPIPKQCPSNTLRYTHVPACHWTRILRPQPLGKHQPLPLSCLPAS